MREFRIVSGCQPHAFPLLKAAAAFETRYGKPLDLDERSFNAGVAILNLDYWRTNQMGEEVIW